MNDLEGSYFYFHAAVYAHIISIIYTYIKVSKIC